MATFCNPALSQEPRDRSIEISPPILRESLMKWLESTGRFHAIASDEFQVQVEPDGLDEILDSEVYVLEEEEQELD